MSHSKCHKKNFEHFKHAKKLGSTLVTMTPQVNVKWFNNNLYISPLFGIEIMLLLFGSLLKETSSLLFKITNYINRLFIIFICILTLIRIFSLWQYLNMDVKWFNVTVILQHLFITLTIILFIRTKKSILKLNNQLESKRIDCNLIEDEKKLFSNKYYLKKNFNFTNNHLTIISLSWSLMYLILCFIYSWYYLKNAENKVEKYFSFLFYKIGEVKLYHRLLIYLLYATFVPFIRQNWIVITAGVYIFFIEYLHQVNLLVLKSIKLNREYYKSNKFIQDPNYILLNHYKDSLISLYEMTHLTRKFEKIFNPLPFMWCLYNFAEFFLLCRIIVKNQDGIFISSLFSYLTNILIIIIVSSRVTTLQINSKSHADQIILDIEVGSHIRDQILFSMKRKRSYTPWWMKSNLTRKSSSSSSSSERERKEKTQLTNFYKSMLINELNNVGKFNFTGWDTFIVRKTLIIIFIESLVTFTVMFLQVSGSLIL